MPCIACGGSPPTLPPTPHTPQPTPTPSHPPTLSPACRPCSTARRWPGRTEWCWTRRRARRARRRSAPPAAGSGRLPLSISPSHPASALLPPPPRHRSDLYTENGIRAPNFTFAEYLPQALALTQPTACGVERPVAVGRLDNKKLLRRHWTDSRSVTEGRSFGESCPDAWCVQSSAVCDATQRTPLGAPSRPSLARQAGAARGPRVADPATPHGSSTAGSHPLVVIRKLARVPPAPPALYPALSEPR